MSWRETLGVSLSKTASYTQNTHNTQKSLEPGNCAYCANSAYGDAETDNANLLETLADVCRGLGITPVEVKEALSPEDIADWRKGAISGDTPAAFARSLSLRRERDQGKRPAHYTDQATCNRCGPVWLWFSGEVLGCPWCWNRAADKPIPRPCSVHCGDCIRFERSDHPHLGHCAKGKPEAIAGLWDTDRRYCERFLPRPARAETKS